MGGLEPRMSQPDHSIGGLGLSMPRPDQAQPMNTCAHFCNPVKAETRRSHKFRLEKIRLTFTFALKQTVLKI